MLCGLSPPRTTRYGKRGRLSFRGCKPPRCISSDRRIMRFMSYTLKTPLLQSAFIPARTVGAITPEQFADFPLGHGGCTYIARQKILPCPSIVIMFLSSFIGILFLIRWLGRYSSPYPPTCATRFPCLGLSSGR